MGAHRPYLCPSIFRHQSIYGLEYVRGIIFLFDIPLDKILLDMEARAGSYM